jgi:hypothetical protein
MPIVVEIGKYEVSYVCRLVAFFLLGAVSSCLSLACFTSVKARLYVSLVSELSGSLFGLARRLGMHLYTAHP